VLTDKETNEVSKIPSVLTDKETNVVSMVSGMTGSFSNALVLDSGAGLHTTRKRNSLFEFESVSSSIIVGNNEEVAVTGKGKMRLSALVPAGTQSVVLSDVALAVDLAVDIVSVRKLTQAGCKVLFEEDRGVVYFKNTIIMVAKMIGGLYLIDIEGSNTVSYVSKSKDEKTSVVLPDKVMSEWMIWHLRMAHPSDKYLKSIKPDLQKSVADFCEVCRLCKSSAKPHFAKTTDELLAEKETGRKKGVVHSDLMGPINIPSKSGYKWILTYMCEQTEYSYVYLLKSKSEQFETFKNFKQEYENTVPWKLRVLRTDNGLEYCNKGEIILGLSSGFF
jgi:hypothetical protein